MKSYIESKKPISKKQSAVLVERLIYRTNDWFRVVGYVVRPKNKKRSLPCIIFNRGGYKEFGQITSYLIETWLSDLARCGYVVIASQYRGNEGLRGKDEYGGADLKDVLSLKNVLKELPGTDTSRIGMVGFSRGGMMTYLALAKVRWVRAAVILSGVADLERMVQERPEMKKVMKEAFGGNRRKLQARSAVRFTKKISKKTPLLIVHGVHDRRVNPQDALELSRKLLVSQLPHRFILYEGSGHELIEVEKEVWKEVKSWLKRFV